MRRNGLAAFVLLIVLTASLAAFATPKFIHYQAALTDPNTGNPVPDNTYSMTFRIYEVDFGGTPMWAETLSVATKNGKFNVKLGLVHPPSDTVFVERDRWLGLTVSPDPEMSPRTAIGAVPYAFMAGNVPDTSINASKLGKESVGKEKIKKYDIDSTLIAEKTIGKDKIRLKDIDSTLIADATIGKDKIRLKDIDSTLIADKTIGKDKIRLKAIDSTLIADKTIGKDKIRLKDIDSTLIADQTIGTDKIADGSILFSDIAPNGTPVAGQIMKWSAAKASWALGDDNTGAGGWVDDPGGNFIKLVSSTDSVGIGVSTPSEKLDVNGSILVRDKANIGNQNVNTGSYAFVAGSYNSALGDFSVVAGGGGAGGVDANEAQGTGSVVCGGSANLANGDYSAIGGGRKNEAGTGAAPGPAATVGGGENNRANGLHSTIGGGLNNEAGISGPFPVDAPTIGGGMNNHAEGPYSTVGGGMQNLAKSDHSTIGGGWGNEAGTGGPGMDEGATVGGGQLTRAYGGYSTISGGQQNTADGDFATVCGGTQNRAQGDRSTVAGGHGNSALGNYSLAAGFNARANHDGSVVIVATNSGIDADSTRSGQVGQMVLRADGNFYLTNTSEKAPGGTSKFLNTSTGAYLTTGGTWTNSSDRDLKENFQGIDGRELLEQVARLPITRWNDKVEDKDITHIGPVAQDFLAIFGVGSDDKTISTIDPAGIALAAIQELLKQSQQKTARVEQLEAQMEEMEMLMRQLLEARSGAEGKK
ncbi:MAG: hypothetical protein E4G91_02935 [Candidatus Zixiibacteriota bacterium]|nr:MAG: hypothetical protein E4G91_02935 [candidate division Zixibacteria bacterium]